MSIEVRVPEEIRDYKESIVAGLSIRQIVCGGIALLMGVPTFLLLKNVNQDLATYVTMVVVVPAFCVGFIKKGGYNFETYLKIKLRSFFGKNKRAYETNAEKNLIPVEIEEYAEIFEELNKENDKTEKERGGKRGIRKKEKRKSERKPEYELVEVTAKSIERARKTAYKSIKAAARANRKKKQKEEKKA